MNTNQKYKLTDKDFTQINKRSLFFFQSGWNYERMQGSGYLYQILPQLRKIYGDNTDELKEMMRTHTQFFNTSNYFSNIITGIDLALEEKEGPESKSAVEGLKTGLLGPFAAIGDSLSSITSTVTGALAATMALQKNPIGIAIIVAVQIAWIVFRWSQIKWAYNQGTSLISDLSARFGALINSATLMGVFMVGAMIASIVHVQLNITPMIGKVPFNLQNSIDLIIPGLLPAALVGLIYWLLGKKKMTNLKVLFIVLVGAVILGATGWVIK